MAPEVLRGKYYTQSADIYSIGIVMSEIASGGIPFQDRQDDVPLALSIYYGLRPKIKESTPEAYRKIMEACWDSDPLKRPDIFKLQTIFTKWRQNPPFNITQQFEQADALDIKNNDTGNINSIFDDENLVDFEDKLNSDDENLTIPENFLKFSGLDQ